MAKKIYHQVKKIHLNSLFVKLAFTVIIGCVVISVILFSVNMKISQGIFVEIFADSQTKIFSQIEDSFYQFYADMAEITASVENNDRVINYLTSKEDETAKELGVIYAMQKQVKQMKIQDYDNLTLLIVGVNGKSSMFGKAERLSVSVETITEMPFSQKADQRKGQMICEYVEKGFTDATKNEPIVVFCRTIQEPRLGEVIGYTFLIMKEEDLRKRYDYFVSGIGDIFVLNQDDDVISTNNNYYLKDEELRSMLGEMVQESRQTGVYQAERNIRGEKITYLVKSFSNTNLKIIGLLNPNKAFFVRYDLRLNIIMVLLISCTIISVIFILVRRQTRPLYKLSGAMRSQKDGIRSIYIEPEGTEEIKELSKTYNEMIRDINHYVERIVETEQAKRSAELHALQMQINPHYIYNTLASIKWMIMQGNAEEATEALEAFIALLRNTISNSDEFITVEQEITNLKNYVLINQKRYGDRIQVDYFIAEDCLPCLLPKLVLQPFVENVFFHAFPNERRGRINVFVSRTKELLTIEIIDDGIGISSDDIDTMLTSSVPRDHFTGIGIKNVDERIKIIYGSDYGIRIDSQLSMGTCIILRIPIKEIV